MGMFKDLFNRYLGENEGIELIAQRLRNGAPYVKAYDSDDQSIIYFYGTGKKQRGLGNQREYDIHYEELHYIRREASVVTPLRPVKDSLYMWHNLVDLDDTYFRELVDQEGENDPNEVIDHLKSIASRLKPYQIYTMDRMNITADLFEGDNIRMYSGHSERLIPRRFIGNRRLVGVHELGIAFDPSRVKILDQNKIARVHRANTDPKRWYEIKQLESVTDKHAIRFTHRKTANAPVHYYNMEIIIDSKAMPSHPFYVEELLRSALAELSKDYPEGYYYLEIFPSEITITWDGKTSTIDAYLDNQRKYPASVDKQPILIYQPLEVCYYVDYPSKLRREIRVIPSTEEAATPKESKQGTKRP